MAGGISWVEYLYARIRTDIGTEHGDVTRFVVQLEYNVEPNLLEPNDWRQVARFDHEPDAEGGHDVTEEGLHMDVYRDEEKAEVRRDFPAVSLRGAPAFCKQTLSDRAPELLARFERWHGIDGNWNG
jgi:hypothetical protein